MLVVEGSFGVRLLSIVHFLKNNFFFQFTYHLVTIIFLLLRVVIYFYINVTRHFVFNPIICVSSYCG